MAGLMFLFVCTGLEGGVNLLKCISEKYEDITYADIFQLASAIAVKVCGALKLPIM